MTLTDNAAPAPEIDAEQIRSVLEYYLSLIHI